MWEQIMVYSAYILALVRAIESIMELSKTPEAVTVIDKLKQIVKNFFGLETYSG